MALQNDTGRKDNIINVNAGKVIHCLHCNNTTYVHFVSHYKERDDLDLIWIDYQWNLYRCPVCSEVTLERISECSEDIDYDSDDQPYIKPEVSILYPVNQNALLPDPHKDLPKELIDDYEEARSIAHISPRSAAALLRLLIEKLCILLGAKGKDINENIAFLVRNGLPQNVQMIFDIVRLIGNNAVHPGTIDLKDDKEIVSKLFILVNIAVEYQITQPKLISQLKSGIPQSKLDAIERRDSK